MSESEMIQDRSKHSPRIGLGELTSDLVENDCFPVLDATGWFTGG